MWHQLLFILPATALSFLLLAGSETRQDPTSTGTPPITLAAALADDMCTWPIAPGPGPEAGAMTSIGGELPPLRYVVDPYPTFNGIAIDAKNNRVVRTLLRFSSLITTRLFLASMAMPLKVG